MLHAYRRNGVNCFLRCCIRTINNGCGHMGFFPAFRYVKKGSIDECMELKYFFFYFLFGKFLFLSGFMFETNRKAFLKEAKAN